MYVIDTGIRASHQEFYQGQVTSGTDYHPGDGYSPTNPCGGNDIMNGGHGTGVASLIGGDGVGVAEGVTLVPVKVFACGSQYTYGIELSYIGAVWATSWVMQQIDARGNRAVVNFSWFYYSDDDCFIAEPLCDPETDPQQCHYNCATSLEANIHYLLYDYDAVVVASANNQNDDYCVSTGNPQGLTQSPARMGYGGMYDPNPTSDPSRRLVITVGGTDDNDARWVYNSTLGSNVGSCVDIYAPADLIRVAYITSDSAYRNQTNALQSSGTSWSAAIVSGIAARILDAYPTKNPREVWDYMRQSATSLTSNFDGDGNSQNDKLVYVSPND